LQQLQVSGQAIGMVSRCVPQDVHGSQRELLPHGLFDASQYRRSMVVMSGEQ
jgi:hypothetical protein